MIFSCFTWKLKEKAGGSLGRGGGAKGMLPPPKLLGAGGAGPPLPTPMLYVTFDFDTCVYVCNLIQIKQSLNQDNIK